MSVKRKVMKKVANPIKPPRRRKRIKAKVEVSPVNPSLTYGEKMVGLTFNQSGDPDVAEIKRLFAKIIDKLSYDEHDAQRTLFLDEAIWRAVEAQMWAVKAWTFGT